MKTYLDWSDYADAGMGDAYADIPKHGGDFAKAVAVCINSRQCETLNKGVMCPSYRLHEDGQLSTGARVRLLKAALNGTLGHVDLLDPQLIQAMELCVSCKGCKRECESNVDMARIKIEYLAQLNARTGLSLRARLFSELPKWLLKPGWLTRLISWRNRHRVLAQLGQSVLGISACTKLPEVVRPPLSLPVEAGADKRPVVLFVDTFSRHYSPDVAQAAIDVLDAAGYAVKLAASRLEDGEARPLCC